MPNTQFADPPSQTAFPVAKAGYPVIAAAAFLTLILALLEWTIPTVASLGLTFFVVSFFRDPDRLVTTAPGAVVSPADGRIIKLEKLENSDYYQGTALKISIFMSIFNVHVNRVPVSGTVEAVDYHPGKFLVASLDKACVDNERNALFIATEEGLRVTVVQIAGLVARRIISSLQPGDAVQRGRRFGMICFGSRLDVYLPPESRSEVMIGQRVHAGSTVLGYLP
jgi:phosphatidylserine decarboxylase